MEDLRLHQISRFSGEKGLPFITLPVSDGLNIEQSINGGKSYIVIATVHYDGESFKVDVIGDRITLIENFARFVELVKNAEHIIYKETVNDEEDDDYDDYYDEEDDNEW